MSVTNPPGWLQNAGSTHTAAQMRTYLGSLVSGIAGASGDTLRPLGGVNPDLGTELIVSQSVVPAMSVLVGPGVAAIPGNESNTQGVYFVCNDAAATLSITAAHATLPRIDIVVINVRDSVYSGASNDSQLQVIAGTPNSSPVAPTAPSNSITLASIAVGAAVTSIVNGNITDSRFYMSAVGGIMKVRNAAARPGTLSIGESQMVWTADDNKLYIWDGAAYTEIFPTSWTTWVPTLTNITLGTGVVTARYCVVGKTLNFRFKFKYGAGSAVGTSPRFSLPFSMHASYTSLEDTINCSVMLYDSGTANYIGSVRVINATTLELMSLNAAGAIGAEAATTSTVPFTWTTNDTMSCCGTVELA
jgi:hypothetical protein